MTYQPLSEPMKAALRRHGLGIELLPSKELTMTSIDCIDCQAATLHRNAYGEPLCDDCRAERDAIIRHAVTATARRMYG